MSIAALRLISVRLVIGITLCVMLISGFSFSFWSSNVAAATLGGEDISTQTQQLQSLLKPDGSLDLSAGFSGSIDAHGYTMRTDAGGAPHFESTAPQAAGDERWKSSFSLPGIKESEITAMA